MCDSNMRHNGAVPNGYEDHPYFRNHSPRDQNRMISNGLWWLLIGPKILHLGREKRFLTWALLIDSEPKASSENPQHCGPKQP